MIKSQKDATRYAKRYYNEEVMSVMTNQKLLKYFFLFVAAFLLFSYFQHFPTFPDPDSFYHAKMAVLIRDQGIVRDFPWLEFTVLKNYYIDHHFLYHLLLVPFVTFLDPLVGIKLATALFAALSITVFYWFLEKFRIRGAFFYSLLLLVNYPFIFRMNLAKASAVVVIILFFVLYFIFNKKYWLLFVLSFIYVWTHDSWPLVMILTALYIIADSIIKAVHSEDSGIMNYESGIKKLVENCKLKIENFGRAFFSKENVKLFISCFCGLLAGVVINPYFPKNLPFYWFHIVKIAIINYKDKINVGAEWYSYNFFDLVGNSSLVFVLLVIGLSGVSVYFISRHSEERSDSAIPLKCERDYRDLTSSSLERAGGGHPDQMLTLFFIFSFFLGLTLRSRRNVEYWSPFAILFSAFLINDYLPYKLEELLLKFKNVLIRKKILTRVISFYFLVAFPFIIGRDFITIKNNYQNGSSVDKYKGASEWLAKNTPRGSIVFHNDWDDFPPLFYYNTHNHYIAGLDPTFMYDYDKELHKKWVDITTGRQENVSQIIKNEFHAEYVFVDKDHVAFENNLKSDGNFTMVYKDGEGKIYKISNY